MIFVFVGVEIRLRGSNALAPKIFCDDVFARTEYAIHKHPDWFS